MKIVKLFCLLVLVSVIILSAQTVNVKGNVSTSTEPVKSALITFTEQNDTTKEYSTLTDSLGNYSIGLITSIEGNTSVVPSKFELAQNYPNPFTNSTAISYKLNKQSDVHVSIYDILGREVKKYNIGEQPIGVHGILWDGSNNFGEKVTSGIYLYRLEVGKESHVNKMVFTRGNGISNNLTLSGNFVSSKLSKETTAKITPASYIVKIKNTDSTKPKIEPLEITGITVTQDTTINIYVQKEVVSIYVMEKDHLFGGSEDVDNYHETLIINTSADSICFTIESPMPDSLQHESVRSPAFGRDAIIPTPYQDYFDIPNYNRGLYTNKPDSSTDHSYIWKNIKLGPSDLMEVPYSNFYGDDGKMFIEKLGTSRFLYMEVALNCSIERDSVDSRYINIEIKETARNITNDTLSRIGIELFVPRELETKFDPPNGSEFTKLYNLISDTIISPDNNKCHLYNQWGTNEGFGFWAEGQEMNPSYFVLPPHQSYEFVFKMKIEPLLEKFEIYPTYGVTYITTTMDRIWPASIITLNNNKYQGEVHYLKEFGLVMPTYILFSINKDTLRVVSPDDIEPTFKPDY
jgi:flagellar hook assembly protein FlgD